MMHPEDDSGGGFSLFLGSIDCNTDLSPFLIPCSELIGQILESDSFSPLTDSTLIFLDTWLPDMIDRFLSLAACPSVLGNLSRLFKFVCMFCSWARVHHGSNLFSVLSRVFDPSASLAKLNLDWKDMFKDVVDSCMVINFTLL
jgi:hypothetical protein